MQFQDSRTGELVKKRFEWAVIIELRISGNPKALLISDTKCLFRRILEGSVQPDSQNSPRHSHGTRESSGRNELRPYRLGKMQR